MLLVLIDSLSKKIVQEADIYLNRPKRIKKWLKKKK